MNVDILFYAGTVLLSVVASWVTMREKVSGHSEKIAAIEKDQDTQRIVNTQLAVAIEKLTHVDDRLGRIEDLMFRALK